MKIGDLFLKILPDDKGFETAVVKSGEKAGDKAGQSLGARLKKAMSPQNLATAGFAAAAVGVGVFAAGLVGAAKALMDIERLNAQTDAAIRSTGGAANVTGDHIEDLAEDMESLTTIERETVQEGANLLLTFTNVRNEVGKGNKIFDRATQTALDLSVALGTDMSSASMLLGKALNDPIKGITALTRAGVQLTKQQKDQIKAFVESGDILSAQKIILAELETQVGGSAEAFANTTAGRIQRFQNDIGNMFESIIVGATKVADFLGDVMDDTAESMGNGFEAVGDLFVGANAEYTESAIATADALEEEYQRGALGVRAGMAAAANEIERGGPVIAEKAGAVAGLFPHAIKARDREIRDATFQNMVSHALGILDGQNKPKVAFEAMLRLQTEELTKQGQIDYLMGLWFDARLAAGLQDGRPGVNQAAQAVVGIIEMQLKELGVDAWSYGNIIPTEVARGINSNLGVVRTAAGGLAGAVRGQIGIRSEPEDHDSPLRGITKWGGNLVKTYAEGIYGEMGTGRRAFGALAGAFVPRVGGMPALAGAGGEAGGLSKTWQLNVNGVPRSFDRRDDFIDALDDLGSFGDGRLSGG